jgi:hypothetical protein
MESNKCSDEFTSLRAPVYFLQNISKEKRNPVHTVKVKAVLLERG